MTMVLLERMSAHLPEMLLTVVVGFQVYLFRQVSEARREHQELRIEIAQHHPTHKDFQRALDKLEASIREQHRTLLETLRQQRINA